MSTLPDGSPVIMTSLYPVLQDALVIIARHIKECEHCNRILVEQGRATLPDVLPPSLEQLVSLAGSIQAKVIIITALLNAVAVGQHEVRS